MQNKRFQDIKKYQSGTEGGIFFLLYHYTIEKMQVVIYFWFLNLDIDDCDPGNLENAIEGVGIVTEFGYCGRNGKCVDGIASYNCSCNQGWTGKACEIDIDECKSMPCKNGGVCFQTIDAYFRCVCKTGFTGKDCSTSKL